MRRATVTLEVIADNLQQLQDIIVRLDLQAPTIKVLSYYVPGEKDVLFQSNQKKES